MKLEELNHWLVLVANFGVIIGIVFLAFEIRQNTEAMYSQTRATVFAGAQEELWKNMEYPDVTLNFTTTDKQLTPEEKIRLDAWLTASMRAREYAWLEYQSGNLSEAQWLGELEVISLVLGTPRNRSWWRDIASPAFPVDFVSVVDELIDSRPEIDYAQKILSIQ
ncbi:MAG: hypothetical protein RL839_14420 [Gammaproteobacteria bacterium]